MTYIARGGSNRRLMGFCTAFEFGKGAAERDTPREEKNTASYHFLIFLLLFALRSRPRSTSASCRLSTRFSPSQHKLASPSCLSFRLSLFARRVCVCGRAGCHKQLASRKCRTRAREARARPPTGPPPVKSPARQSRSRSRPV